jgi:hypothetical protein
LIQINKLPNVINLTNHTPFSNFCKGCIFFKVEDREKRGERKNIVKAPSCVGRRHAPIHHDGGGKCIESRLVMWCSATERCRMHCPKGVDTSNLLARLKLTPSNFLFLFNFIYANTKFSFTHTILLKKHYKIPKKSKA